MCIKLREHCTCKILQEEWKDTGPHSKRSQMFPLDYKFMDLTKSQSYLYFWSGNSEKAVTVNHSVACVITVGAQTVSSCQLCPKTRWCCGTALKSIVLKLPQSHKRRRKSLQIYPRFQASHNVCKKEKVWKVHRNYP